MLTISNGIRISGSNPAPHKPDGWLGGVWVGVSVGAVGETGVVVGDTGLVGAEVGVWLPC
jgi:hypothetical protein